MPMDMKYRYLIYKLLIFPLIFLSFRAFSQENFKKSQVISNIPVITTNAVTNIAQTTATCGGNILSDGGSNIINKGICWDTSKNPSIINSKTNNSSGGLGSYSHNMSGLAKKTTYYVRAYATNSYGTGYGDTISFTTLPGTDKMIINGTITFNSNPVSQVIISLTGSSTGADTTDSNGNYSFTVIEGGNYTITPKKAYYTFIPASMTFNNLQSSQTLNFTSSLITYTISGQILNKGLPLSGATVMLNGYPSGSMLTDTNGNYSFSVYAGGNDTIIPYKSGYTFSPVNKPYKNVISNQKQNFTATLNTYTISGQITLDSIAMSGVTVLLSGSTSGSTTTAANGSYKFTVNALGTYTITPSKKGITFSPVNITFDDLAGNKVQDFTASIDPPAVPVLSLPPNSSKDNPTTLNLSWEPAENALSYDFQMAKTSGFFATDILMDTSNITKDTIKLKNLKTNTTYFWKVRSKNAGGLSVWSTIWKFTTIAGKPSSVVLQSPTNSINLIPPGYPPQISCTWLAASLAFSYQIQVSLSDSFKTLAFEKTGITGLTQEITGLTFEKYYWRVRAVNTEGTSEWSTIWSFSISPPNPEKPYMLSPKDESQFNYTIPVLKWNRTSYASTYGVQVALSNTLSEGFTGIIISVDKLTDTSYTVYGLKSNTTYYWRVNSENKTGASSWSIPWFFRVINPSGINDITIPLEYKLHRNYPNPFNPSTVIGYELPVMTKVNLSIYNTLGQKIRTLLDNEQQAGTYSITWDAKDDNGKKVSSGIYHYRMFTGKFSEIKKMIYMK
jgi:hypothetical protein